MVSDKKYRGREAGLKIFKQRLQSEVTKDLQFFSAANPKIHVRRLQVFSNVADESSTWAAGYRPQTDYARMGCFPV